MTRREARDQALCIVFERMFKDESVKDIVSLAMEARDVEPDSFAQELAQGVCDNADEIDEKIKSYSIKWANERLSKIVLSILRIAIYEFYHIDNIPVSVTINEAVELAKKYGGEGDSAFINGLLGTLVRSEKLGINDKENDKKKSHHKK